MPHVFDMNASIYIWTRKELLKKILSMITKHHCIQCLLKDLLTLTVYSIGS